MKRRDLLKTGIALASVSALSGCSNKTDISFHSSDEIIPKQTDTYIFSCPLPFDFKVIDELEKINSKYKKSQIKTLFNNVPLPLSSAFNQWLQVAKNYNYVIKSYDDFRKYVEYAISKGFDVCYLLNSPKPFTEKDYDTFKKEFVWLLGYLKDIGIKNIKVSNIQTAAITNETDSSFNLSMSTATEYHNLAQYQKFIKEYPNVDLIDVPIDENQNFYFLRNLRKLFPDIKIEIMVDEYCTKGCPARISHISELLFCKFDCYKLKRENKVLYSFKTSMVYPWNLGYYSAIGINNFKLIIGETRTDFKKFNVVDNYLNCVENGTDVYKAKDFLSSLFDENIFLRENITASHLLPYLPDIRHFVKNGQYCSSRCGVECHYCNTMADKMTEFLKSVDAEFLG